MNYFRLIVEEFRNMGELLAAVLLLTLPSMKRRPRFALRSIAGAAVCVLFTLLFIPLRNFAFGTSNIIIINTIHAAWYALLIVLVMVYVSVCFKLNLTEILWIMVLAYAMQHFVYALVNELVFMGFGRGLSQNYPAYISICIAACVILYFIFYKIFIPNIRYRDHINIADSHKSRIIYLVLLALFIAASFVNQSNARQVPAKINYLSVISDLFNCFLILVAQYSSLRANRLTLEKTTAIQLYNHAMKQYDAFKDSVDYVNIKCHDFKHQIRRLQQDGNLNPESFEEIEKNLSIYESFVKTGNETLDIVLTDKYLSCLSNDIALSYMTDAAALNKLKESDIYILFSNMLDNAIEYVKKLEEEEKRFIRVSVKPIGNMLLIHQENIFEGKMEFFEGLPVTTQSNKAYHGFGGKSMKLIAEKYGGKLNAQVIDGMFKLDILLPKMG